MRINPISSLWSVKKTNISNDNYNQGYIQNPLLDNTKKDVFVKSSNIQSAKGLAIPFLGYDVYIIDGGNHANDMEHFVKAINENVDVHMYRAENSRDFKYNKPLKNIEEQLNYINRYELTDENSFVAIPVSITVPLQNLAEQYKRITGNYIHLKPHTVQSNKEKLLNFLKTLYYNPDSYRKYIQYMDPENKGLEYAYGIIQEINKLKCRKVYIPVAMPQVKNMEWLAKERGEIPELTNYLATGYDKDGKVQNMMNYLKEKEWYDFNLLALSDADVVNMKKMDNSEHLYSAYDTTIKDGERGVYNFTPIRENGKIVGYSFNDTETNEYPYSEFPHKDKVELVSKFVGLSTDEVVADDEKTARFKQALSNNADLSEFSDKLYPVWKLFDENDLYNNKIYDRGDFVDSTLQYYFRRNGDYKIIYPEADSESSGRPSVMGLRDGNYAMMTALSRDVNQRRFLDSLIESNVNLQDGIRGRLSNARDSIERKDYVAGESYLGVAKEYVDIMGGLDRKNMMFMEVYKLLAESKYHNGDYLGANGLYNAYLNNLCKNYVEQLKANGFRSVVNERDEITEIFDILADIADKRGEYFPAQHCRRAAKELREGSKLGNIIINRRANDDTNIGDIFA